MSSCSFLLTGIVFFTDSMLVFLPKQNVKTSMKKYCWRDSQKILDVCGADIILGVAQSDRNN